jgi:hypothetical protein
MLLGIGEIMHNAFPLQMTRKRLTAATRFLRTARGYARRVILIGVLRLRCRFSF